VIDRVEVPQASPDPGDDGYPTYRIPLEKPRRGAGHHYETRNVTDDGADKRVQAEAIEVIAAGAEDAADRAARRSWSPSCGMSPARGTWRRRPRTAPTTTTAPTLPPMAAAVLRF
jgi:hypothetical protein